MPRPLRIYSKSKVYHTIIKGIDNHNIFFDEKDRLFFLKQLLTIKNQFNSQIYSYCLMSNHVHLVIKIEDEFLSKFMQSMSIRYAHYFNCKYERKGPFLQNRFKSKCVENQKYFLEVCRYIHRNPEKAKIAKTEDYKWSSFKEYIGKEKIINKNILLHYFNNDINEFIKYTILSDLNNVNDSIEYEIIEKLTDEELINIIISKFGINKNEDISSFFKNRKNIEKDLIWIKNIQGTNITQISRVTKIGRKILKRINR